MKDAKPEPNLTRGQQGHQWYHRALPAPVHTVPLLADSQFLALGSVAQPTRWPNPSVEPTKCSKLHFAAHLER
jgi:hypothetical protein